MAPARRSEPAPGRWWRTVRTSFWLGWQIESNWTDPFLFAVYSIARPLGGVMILVVMFVVVAGGREGPLLDFFVVGSAFWAFVVAGMQGMATGLLDDREHWHTMRAIYIAPMPFEAYVVGRALARLAASAAATVVTLAVGWLALGVEIEVSTFGGLYVVATAVLGLVGVLALGFLVLSMAISVSGEAWRMPEAVGAALYLLCGVVFPITVLPPALGTLAALLPLTWWLEALRRGLLGPGAMRSFPWADDATVLGLLAVTTLAAVGLGALVFRAAERRARQLGMLDAESAY